MPPAAAAAAGAGLSILGNVAGSAVQGNAIRNGAAIQEGGAQAAAGKQQEVYNSQTANLAPYQQAGTSALSQMQDPYFQQSFTPQDFQNNMDPAYQFNVQQGQQALERSAAARGGLLSGGMAKDLSNYAQGQASNEYQNAYNRFNQNQQNRYGRLSTLAGLGQNANSQFNQASQNYANMWGADTMDRANIQGIAVGKQGEMWGNTIRGTGQTLGNLVSGIGATGSGSGSKGSSLGSLGK